MPILQYYNSIFDDVSISAEFWTFDKDTGKLKNKEIQWMYFQNSFSIPDEGEEGYIEEKSENSEGVMTVIKGDTGDENEVPIIQLKPKNDLFSHEQMWVRSMICDNGYFTLENPSSGAVFTACYGPWSNIKEYRECEYEGINWVSIISI